MQQAIGIQQLAAGLKVSVPKVELKPTGEYYEVNVKFGERKEWSMDKLYAQVEQLMKLLACATFDVEQVGEGLLKKHDPQATRRKLNQQLAELAARRDVLRLPIFRDFLHVAMAQQQLDSYLSIKDQPIQPLWKIECGRVAVIDFHYDAKDDALFTLETLSTVKDKIKTFLSSLFKGNESDRYPGQLGLYLSHKRIWHIQFRSKPLCFSWNKKSTMLAVCLQSQEILIYRVAVELGYQEHHLFTTIKAFRCHHQILLPASSSMCYALGSNDFTVYAVKEATKVHSYMNNLSNASMAMDDRNDRLFVASQQGLISVYALNQKGYPEFDCTFGPKQTYSVTRLVLSEDMQYLLAGTTESQVLVFQVYKKGKEKLSQHISTIVGPQNIPTFAFCKEYKLLYVSYLNNIVAIGTDSRQERVIEQHTQPVRMIKYDPEARLLVSSAQDGFVCFTPYNIKPREPERLQEQPPLATSTRPAVMRGIKDWPSEQ